MALIPETAGLSMRLQTEQALRPITPVTELPADLLALTPGKPFSARIQEVLPENTYKALVAGRTLTLALPESAKPGDTLELVVVERTPHAVVARLTDGTPVARSDEVHEFTTLSRTAQLIGNLLPHDGESAAPAPLNRGQPLLPRGPLDAADIAPQLAKAVSQSGMFYEAHQVDWVLGKRPLSDILAEPQAAYSKADTLAAYRQELHASEPWAQNHAAGRGPSQPAGLQQAAFRSEFSEPPAQAATSTPTTPTNTAAAGIPEELHPLVQQQLDAAATQRMAWHGEVWPEQRLDWTIEPDGQHSAVVEDDAPAWITSLRLTTPRLGKIDARLRLTPQGVQINIATAQEVTAADLRAAGTDLQQSLAAAGVPLLSLHVKHEERG